MKARNISNAGQVSKFKRLILKSKESTPLGKGNKVVKTTKREFFIGVAALTIFQGGKYARQTANIHQ